MTESKGYIIREARLDDLPVLLQFEQDLIKVERPMNPTIKSGKISYYDVAAFIKADDSTVLVAEKNGEVCASGYARILDDRAYLTHDKQGYLGFMFTAEGHRGKGLNQEIVRALVQWCDERGIHEIKLDVYPANKAAIRAYEKMGFYPHMINMRLNRDRED